MELSFDSTGRSTLRFALFLSRIMATLVLDVVDIIGVDSYDAPASGRSPRAPTARLDDLFNQRLGLTAVVEFARAERKPISIPEWGLVASGYADGAGDDPLYIDAIALVVRSNVVRYQSYFSADPSGQGVPLTDAPRSLAAYRVHFGRHGDSL